MNLSQTLDALFNRQHMAVAQIVDDKGGGRWSARTQSGVSIVLSGQTQIGQTVFYDMGTRKIIAQAPNLTVIDVPV